MPALAVQVAIAGILLETLVQCLKSLFELSLIDQGMTQLAFPDTVSGHGKSFAFHPRVDRLWRRIGIGNVNHARLPFSKDLLARRIIP